MPAIADWPALPPAWRREFCSYDTIESASALPPPGAGLRPGRRVRRPETRTLPRRPAIGFPKGFEGRRGFGRPSCDPHDPARPGTRRTPHGALTSPGTSPRLRTLFYERFDL